MVHQTNHNGIKIVNLGEVYVSKERVEQRQKRAAQRAIVQQVEPEKPCIEKRT